MMVAKVFKIIIMLLLIVVVVVASWAGSVM